MKKATLQDALNARPCYDAKQIKTLFGKRKTLNAKQVAALGIPDRDKVWALTRPFFLDTKEKAVRFAVFCAEQSLPAFESRFPDDKRPRTAIDMAKAWLQSPTARAAAAAADAADAADAAADAADAAAYAADAAAYAAAAAAYAAADAADAAAYAAAAAADAADAAAAAYAAYAAAAADAAQLKFLVKLLTEVK